MRRTAMRRIGYEQRRDAKAMRRTDKRRKSIAEFGKEQQRKGSVRIGSNGTEVIGTALQWRRELCVAKARRRKAS